MTAAALFDLSSVPIPGPAWPASAVLPPGALAIVALDPGGCRWPEGAVDEPAFRFCNAPCRRLPYCETHRRPAHRRSAR